MEVRVKRTDDLFHSDTFLGEEFSDELYHWKYIKRIKRPNGTWRYIYDKKSNELTQLRKEADRTQGALDAHYNMYNRNMYKQDMRDAMANVKNNPDGPANVENWYKNHKDHDYAKEKYNGGFRLRNDADRAKHEYENRRDSIGGKVDAAMEKHGEKIAETLNKPYKYIKRVKGKNGKYRYIYDVKDAVGVDERKRLVDESNNYKFRSETSKKYEDKLSRDLYDKDPDEYYKTLDKSWRLKDWSGHAERRVDKALEEYGKTPLGKIESVFNRKKMKNHHNWLR